MHPDPRSVDRRGAPGRAAWRAAPCLPLAALCLAYPAYAQDAGGASPDTPSVPPPADTVLPRSGVDPTISDFREHLLDAYGDPTPSPRGVSAPNLQITGQLGVSEEYTTNVGAVAGNNGQAGSDFITNITPGITITDTSQRLKVNLNYQPTAQIYAENSSFSQLQEQGSGFATATLLPGWLYLDARGSISQQAVFGGVGPISTVSLSPDERETVSSFSVSPYVTRTLGGSGTAQAGVSYSYSATDGPGALTGEDALLQRALLQNADAYGSSSLGTERAYSNFTTGENYGRLQDKIGIDASYYTGSGALGGGRRVLLTDDVSYAVTRLVTLLGEAGYESLDYPNSNYAYIGAIGSGGVRLTPTKGSTLTLEYRYVDGFGSVYANGSVQVSPRIRVFGGYSEGISTFDQEQQNNLLDGSDTATGVAASALQAGPLLSGSNFFGANQALNRLQRLDLTATYLGNADTVTVSLQRETTTEVGRQTGFAAPSSTSGIFGSAADTHTLSPTLSVSGFLQFGSNETGLAAEAAGDTLTASLSLDKSFAHNLSAFVRVTGVYDISGSAAGASGLRGLSGDQTNVLIGGVKRF